MKKRKSKKEIPDEELELLDDEMTESQGSFDPFKIASIILFVFTIFTFSALFGLAGEFGRTIP
jgi:hypothetical protein